MKTGMDLKLERIRERVKARAIANTMGVSPTRVAHIEGSAVVQPETVSRYLEALATCVRERTSHGAAAL